MKHCDWHSFPDAGIMVATFVESILGIGVPRLESVHWWTEFLQHCKSSITFIDSSQGNNQRWSFTNHVQPHSIIEGWLNKLWCTYKELYYRVIKNNILMNILQYGHCHHIRLNEKKTLYTKLHLFLFPSSIKECIFSITCLFTKYFLSVFRVLSTMLSMQHKQKTPSQKSRLLKNHTKINNYKSCDC